MKKPLISRLYNAASSYLYIQLTVTLVSLPFLSSWGLPFSLLSPIGNILFLPIMGIFLLIASLIFFTQLLLIPNGILLLALEFIQSWWYTVLSIGPSWVLVGFPTACTPLFAAGAIAGLLLPTLPYFKQKERASAAIFLLLAGQIIVAQWWPTYEHSPFSIPCGSKELLLVPSKRGIAMIDDGAFGASAMTENLISFTLIPELYKRVGHINLQTIILLRPSKRAFDAVTSLCSLTTIKEIYIPYWQGENDSYFMRSYGNLRRQAEKHGVTIKRFGENKKVHIPPITITAQREKQTYHSITFPCYTYTVQKPYDE